MTDYSKMSEADILTLAGGFGPGIIGHELYDLAQSIAIRTDNGQFGPALLDPDYGLDISPWDEHSRRVLLALARTHELPVKSNASREDIAKALVRAKIFPAALGEAGNGTPTGDDEGAE